MAAVYEGAEGDDNYESENNGLEYPNKYVVYVFPGIKNNTKMNKNYKVSPKKLEEYLEAKQEGRV